MFFKFCDWMDLVFDKLACKHKYTSKSGLSLDFCCKCGSELKPSEAMEK